MSETTDSRVQIEITSALATVLGQQHSDGIVVDKKVAKGATMGELLVDLAADLGPKYQKFHQLVYDPETRDVQVMIILNDNVLQSPNETEAKLSDGDRVMLAIVYGGG